MPLRHRQRKAKVNRCTTCRCDLRRHGCTSKTCRYPYRSPTEEEVKRRVAVAVREREATQAVSSQPISPAPETQTCDFWRRCEKQTKTRGHGKRLRLRLLEWLRLKSLELGETGRPLNDMSHEERAALLSEHGVDFRHISTGEYHVLLSSSSNFVRWFFSKLSHKGEPILRPTFITVLKPIRAYVFDKGTKVVTERTLLEPGRDDIDPSHPGNLSPSRLFLSVAYGREWLGLKQAFKQIVHNPQVSDARRKRGRFSGRKSSLARMWDALHLWESLKLYDTAKPLTLSQVGYKAQCFGPRDKDRYQHVKYYESRGHDVWSLAKEMIHTALQPQAEWWKRFS